MDYKAHILIVDDEDMNRTIYSKIFRNAGYSVDTAYNSESAFKSIKIKLPDLILIDIMLGNESGFDFLEKLKKIDEYKFIYMVLITSVMKSSEHRSKGFEMGANGYISRPIEKRELLARIDAFIQHKQTIDQLQKSEEKFRKIIDRNPDAMLVINPEGYIEFANPAAENIFKLGMDELLSRVFGFPVIKNEHTEIQIVRDDKKQTWAEMRTIDIDWDQKPSYLTSIRDVTKRKKMESAIRESEQNLRITLQSIGEAVIVTDEKGLIVRFNKGAEKLTGYSLTKVFKQPLYEFFNARFSDNDLPLNNLFQIITSSKEGTVSHSDAILKKNNGSDVHISFSMSVVKNSEQEIIGTILIIHDNTMEHKYTQALQESEIRFRSLFEQSGNGLLVHDVMGNIIDTNNRITGLFGFSKIEFLEKNLFDLFIKNSDSESLRCDLLRDFRNSDYLEFDGEFSDKSGSVIYSHVSSSRIETGKETVIYSVFTDISKQKKLKAALEKSETRFKQAMIATNDVIWEYNRRTCESYFSPRLNEILGYPAEAFEWTDEKWFQHTKPGEYNNIKEILNTYASIDNEFNYEFEMKTAEDTWNWLLMRGKVVATDNSCEAELLSGIIMDISIRKKIEAEVRKNLEEKETLIKELYHRTKNNMQVISSIIQLKKHSSKDSDIVSVLDDINDKLLTMALVHQKLYESHDLSTINLNDYLKDLIIMTKGNMEIINSNVALNLECENIYILIDIAIPFGLVINELLSNANKYAFPGNRTGTIDINIYKDSENNLHLKFSDDGIGFPADTDPESVFSLGLQIVKDLIERQLGGSFDLELNDGVEYKFVIPQDSYTSRV